MYPGPVIAFVPSQAVIDVPECITIVSAGVVPWLGVRFSDERVLWERSAGFFVTTSES